MLFNTSKIRMEIAGQNSNSVYGKGISRRLAGSYYVIHLGGGWMLLGEGAYQKITEDHNHKKMAKLKVLKKEIITPRISYQVVAQEVISSNFHHFFWNHSFNVIFFISTNVLALL